MKCLLDLDGVLVDTIEPIFGHLNLPNFYNDPKNYGTYKCLEQHQWDSVGPEFWANAGFMPDALTILHRVETVFGHENICLLTKPTGHPDCAGGKIRWIQKNLPQYKDQYFVGSAKFVMAHPGIVLVDDHDANVDAFVEHGGKAVLLPRKWNRRYHMDTIESLEIDLWQLLGKST